MLPYVFLSPPPPLLLNSKSASSRLAKVFDGVAETKKAAFIPYLTAGYPKKADTVDLMLALQARTLHEIYHRSVCLFRYKFVSVGSVGSTRNVDGEQSCIFLDKYVLKTSPPGGFLYQSKACCACDSTNR